MFKFKISLISDGLFIIFSSFLLSFTLSFYLLKNNVKSILIATPFSIIIFSLYMMLHKNKTGRLKVKREDEERFLKCVNALCFASKEEGKKTVFLTLERLGKKPFLSDGGILCQNDFFFVNFSYDNITTGGVIKAYKKTPEGKNLVYVGVKFTDEAIHFVEGFADRIKLIPLSDFFSLIKKTCTMPEGGILPQRKKPNLLSLLKGTFSRKKIKTYALYGSFLLAMSRFVFFPIWYIISGSVFIIYAITVKFFAPKSIEKTFI